MPVTRYIAIDLGDRRTGLAVADDHTRLAAPWTVLEVPLAHDGGRRLLEAIDRLLARDYPARQSLELVVGLPLHMDGSESERSAIARRFADQLRQHLGLTVHLADERLTSKQADWAMDRSGLTHLQKKRRRDAIAAAALLQGFLNARDRLHEPAHHDDRQDPPTDPRQDAQG
ncbi:MAG: putative pre-16S rRNA nuclease [Phycisphaerales bacterium]|nr:MAG: putative pre-16S rRNA nuclease [Phycisphaerales bacterium]